MAEKVEAPVQVEIEKLNPRAIFGMNGKVRYGLQLHPDNKNMIYPLGNKISVENLRTSQQEFVSGHTNTVSCLHVSASGKFLASGQKSHMGFRAFVILWDFAERKELARHDLHKVLVQSVCFTAFDKYVVSIGGQDDGTVIVFDIESYTPICRAVAARGISGNPLLVYPLHNNSSFFIVAGDRHLRMWSIQRDQKKLFVHDVSVGKHQRCYNGMRISQNDEFIYIGTMTGDIVKVVLNCCDATNVTKQGYIAAMQGAFGIHNPRKPYGKDCNRYVNGVRDLCLVDEGLLLVGAGDGTVELIEERKDQDLQTLRNYPGPTWPLYKALKNAKVNGAVTSIIGKNPSEFYIGTELCEIYHLNINTFKLKLLKTCHRKSVYEIVFPKNISSVFATAGYETIRIWSTKRLQELLRIIVYNFHCASLSFTNDGKSIVSAWNDGVIRAFTPISGRLIYAIPNAHNKGCSALSVSSNGRSLVTGGIEGQVRVWKIEPFRQSLIGMLKDHSGPVTSLHFNQAETEVISACSDGSCVIWDITRMTRKQVITANTQFMTARYYPTGVQILTCGSDGRISYWMVYNGSLIRELEGSRKSSVNCISFNPNGDYFISVGSDQHVKVWDYHQGVVLCEGNEHASSIISTACSPCGKFFVSGSADGSIIIWDIPEKYWGKKVQPNIPIMDKGPPTKAVSETKGPIGLQKENVENLVSVASKRDPCCVECPPVNKQQMPDINEACHYIPDVKKC